MKRFLLHNLGWKALSVLLALVLWIVVAREPELATSISIPLLLRNVPDDLDISSDVLERVHVEVRGPSGRLVPENLSQAAVVLDLEGVQPGERTFTIYPRNVRQLPIGVAFYRAVPSQVSLRFERLISRDVPIEPAYLKGPPDGYGVVKYSFTPPKLRVRGPENRVQRLNHITSDPIDLSGVVSQKGIRVQARVGDPQVRLESSPIVTFNVTMAKAPNKEVK
ncbi:MAG: CdaR family protein [Acidobacteriota bacterium]|nr:CdaR family protein [Acidobacteriota bacterium]